MENRYSFETLQGERYDDKLNKTGVYESFLLSDVLMVTTHKPNKNWNGMGLRSDQAFSS